MFEKYQSPIDKIYGDIEHQIIQQDEEHLLFTVNQAIGYEVDKDELIKALQYDRDQYSKGFRDAKKQILEKIYEMFNGIQCYDGTGYDIYSEIEEGIKDI